MKGKDRRRGLERAKTLLIILLACSALYLATVTLLPGGPRGLWDRLFVRTAEDSVQAGQGGSFRSDTLQPAALAVTGSEGRYAMLYDQADLEGYTQVSPLLAEALSAAGTPQRISSAQWRQALGGPGVYLEYLGSLPLRDMSRWLAGQDNPALGDFTSQRILVRAEELCFYDEGRGAAYAAALPVSLEDGLATLAQELSPNGGRFAFEETGYARLRPETLLRSSTPEMAVLAADTPIGVTEDGAANDALARILRVLSFHPQTNPLYTIPGGLAINDGGDTLRISSQGVVTFRQSGEEDPRFPVGEHPLDMARTLAEQTVGALCGDARLYLRAVEETDGVTTVTFGYAYLGGAIQVGEEGWCVRLTLENGAVSALTLYPRHYAAQAETTVLLPQEQAAATLSGRGTWNMRVYYEDHRDGQTLAPFWAASRM